MRGPGSHIRKTRNHSVAIIADGHGPHRESIELYAIHCI